MRPEESCPTPEEKKCRVMRPEHGTKEAKIHKEKKRQKHEKPPKWANSQQCVAEKSKKCHATKAGALLCGACWSEMTAEERDGWKNHEAGPDRKGAEKQIHILRSPRMLVVDREGLGKDDVREARKTSGRRRKTAGKNEKNSSRPIETNPI